MSNPNFEVPGDVARGATDENGDNDSEDPGEAATEANDNIYTK